MAALLNLRQQLEQLDQLHANLAHANATYDRDFRSLKTSFETQFADIPSLPSRLSTMDKTLKDHEENFKMIDTSVIPGLNLLRKDYDGLKINCQELNERVDANINKQNELNRNHLLGMDELRDEQAKHHTDIQDRFKDINTRHERLEQEIRSLATVRPRSPSLPRHRSSRDRGRDCEHLDYPFHYTRLPLQLPPAAPPPYSHSSDANRTLIDNTNTVVCPSPSTSHSSCNCQSSTNHPSCGCSSRCSHSRGCKEEGEGDGKKCNCGGHSRKKGHRSREYDAGLGGLVFGQYEGSAGLFGGKKKGTILAVRSSGSGRRR